jgi:putative transcriptional regulator
MSEAGKRIIDAMRDAVAFSQGELPEDAYRVHIPERVDVKAIHEQGKRQPDPAARTYLKVVEKTPDFVINALNTP